jgi:hypothetical protein
MEKHSSVLNKGAAQQRPQQRSSTAASLNNGEAQQRPSTKEKHSSVLNKGEAQQRHQQRSSTASSSENGTTAFHMQQLHMQPASHVVLFSRNNEREDH